MKSVIRDLAAAALVTIAPIAFGEEKSAEVAKLTEVINLKVIDEVNLGGDQNSTSRQRNIHRIRSKAAFERLGGKKPPIDFDKMDLVIVKGWLGCAKGNVEIATEEQVVVFSVQIVDHCRHADAILCVTPYVGQFAVSKHTDIAPYVFIKGRADVLGKGKIGDLLNNTNATHLELNRCGVTDADLAKLKEFKNLRHLHLCGNKITDAGLAHLTHMTNLISLYLNDNLGITDAGLEHLRESVSSKIQEVGISGTSVTHDGLAKLRKWGSEQGDEFGPQISHSLVTPQIYD